MPSHPLLLDGGLATHLTTLGADLSTTALWSGILLRTQPSLIQRAHLNFYLAGADVAITASYQASVRGLITHLHVDDGEAVKLLKESVKVAKRARRQAVDAGVTRVLYVAGSIGPYGAFLANGSEYRGDYTPMPTRDEFKEFHRGRIIALKEEGADFFAVETMPCVQEIEAILEVLKEEAEDIKVWVGVTVKESQEGVLLANGTDLAEVCDAVRQYDQVTSIGVNCIPRHLVSPALSIMKKHMAFWPERQRKSLIAYPNSGEVWDEKARNWKSGSGLDGRNVEEWMKEWIGDVGVSIVGGCCRVEPEEIKTMRSWLDDEKHCT
jgi:homocysteine S-methyltransferase